MMTGTPLRATFFGTSSIYLTDGTTGIFTDAFLTRPPLLKVAFGRIRPKPRLIASILEQGNVGVLDAIFTAHSHHDHALDSADVIKLKGGILYGSESTLNIGRGAGLDESRLHRIADGDRYRLGDFDVQVFEGRHSPGNRYPGIIDRPLSTPARGSAFKDGGCFSYLVIHPSGRVFIHPSANFVPNRFDGVHADVLYLGIGALGVQDGQFRNGYWRHVVDAIQPRLIIPVHWDNFGRPLSKRLRPLPRFMDRFAGTTEFLDRQTARGAPAIRWQGALETIALFAG